MPCSSSSSTSLLFVTVLIVVLIVLTGTHVCAGSKQMNSAGHSKLLDNLVAFGHICALTSIACAPDFTTKSCVHHFKFELIDCCVHFPC